MYSINKLSNLIIVISAILLYNVYYKYKISASEVIIMIKFGVIGTGWIAEEFVKGAQIVKGFDFTAVYSRKAETGKAFADKFGGAEVYDDFTDGLVKNYDGDWEFSMDDYNRKTITGTSILYTGATVDGTFSGQMLRNCYRTAARYFCDFIS